MKQTHHSLSAILLVLLLVACGPLRPRATLSPLPPTSPPTTAVSAANTPTLSRTPALTPADTPALTATATWIPTLPPVVPTPTVSAAADLLETMEAIETEMESIRGLEMTSAISRTLMTRQQLAAYLEHDFAQDYPPDEISADARVLAAFDFVPEDFDLQRTLLDLYESEILGLYDDEANAFYIVSDGEFDLLDQITTAHESVHALQDEQFGLDTFVDEDRLNDDQVLARLSLVEGDATLAMSGYLMAHVSELTTEDLATLQAGDAEGSQDALAATPPIILETFEFPYTYGLNFVTALQEQGWAAVDSAFADPPQSTEQILHPKKYFTRDEPTLVALPPLTDTLGTGWYLVEAETLGEFQTGLYLAQQVDQATADLACEGWDGDRYALYAGGDTEVLLLAIAWDSPQDRDEFVTAYTRYAENKYGGGVTRSAQAERWWETPDQNAVLAWGDTTTLVVISPDQTVVQKALTAVLDASR